MRISKKLPIAAAILTIITIGVSSIAGLIVSSNAVEKQTSRTLKAITDGRSDQLAIYLSGIESELKNLSLSQDTAVAFMSMKFSWGIVEGDRKLELQSRYIENNPNSAQDRHLFDHGKIDKYDETHKNFHSIYRDLTLSKGYDDLYFVDANGDVIYSVFKKSDFATNLKSGEWKNSGLARVWLKSMSAPKDDAVLFEDYAPHAPSQAAAAFIARPLYRGEEPIGAIILQMPNAGIASIMNKTTGLGETGETLLVKGDGFLISDSQKTEQVESLNVQLSFNLNIFDQNVDGISTGMLENYRGSDVEFAVKQFRFINTDWIIATLISSEEVRSGITAQRNIILLIAAVLLVIALVAAILFSRSITQPISKIISNMEDLISGETDLNLSGSNRTDEIGDMFKAIAVFRDAALEKEQLEHQAKENSLLLEREREQRELAQADEAQRVKKAVDLLASGLSKLSSGDLSINLNEPFSGDLDRLRVDFNASVVALNEAMSQIGQVSSQINDNSNEMRDATSELAKRTETQAASLEETSAALDEITTTVKETSDRATEAADRAKQARLDGEATIDVVGDAIAAMSGIEKASGDINNIINVIDEIAFQTNLLALNAGVEAARAGEAGKGFAVVAQEVRELAQRSADAAKEIKTLISDSSDQVDNGVKLVKLTGESLDKIANHINSIDEQIGTISSGAAEQLVGIQEVNSAVNSMDQMTQRNAAMVEENTAVTHQMSDETGSLSSLINRFQLSGSELTSSPENKVGSIQLDSSIERMSCAS